MNKSEFATALQKDRSWATKFFDGSQKTITEDEWNTIFEMFDMRIEAVDVNPAPVEFAHLQKACKTEESIKLVGHLADYISRSNSSRTLPYIPTEVLVSFGEEMVRAAHENPDKPGKVGRIGIEMVASIVSKLNEPEQKEACSHPIPMLGCIAAGSPVYVDDVNETVCAPKAYPKDHFALQVCGDSAEHDGGKHKLPSIPDGSTIIMRKLADGEEAKAGKLYAVSNGHGSTLKLLKGKKLGSLNPKYSDFEPLGESVVQAEFVEILK